MDHCTVIQNMYGKYICCIYCGMCHTYLLIHLTLFYAKKLSYRQKLAEGSVRLLGGKPGDRSLGLPGNLVGYMPQSTRLMIDIKMRLTIELVPACSWSSPSQKHSPILGGFST